jgi:hypothetical protein
MTKDEATQKVLEAGYEVNPNLRTLPRGSPGRIGIRVDARGNVFDVYFSNAGRLYQQYAAAAREALGDECGIVRE